MWECSHIGGDRFAANIVCLPDGVYYGRVEPDGPPACWPTTAPGSIDLDHYRGRSCLPPLVQAAELFARRHLDERRIDGLSVAVDRARGRTAPSPCCCSSGAATPSR